ncbi:54S ribosomal protein L27, mitochondrial [Komagataella phaffii CBS 7435]|uniref:Mitochondrial ribosomal protein of the large subunit n=2 Tax=Komagataella phaffii TaxID=460519 RepID=C4R187_KOMPG|nr:mitochondrial 54S ribosomal protein YmL27 [Komagataella phaffii GS115]AOA62147.1 GQ67_00680T0 [Komagataella phaffii]CAH2448212.1 54S ribosomal protein L27, mitochondrial [Komagataella phaffii CBS 7435]AOA67802.1 GQ68_00708T0 [Komagataella phaffii GS115]CAY69261.1 Mitochondrial ribosomal protein of the large subunit [Komagataella phaffii GS115]CCA38349.1 54S ribosomal protein L27, mitochondrial [Komagataella phaffii CBS 7435]
MSQVKSIRSFHSSAGSLLKRPWKTYKDGTLFYGESKTGNNRVPLGTKQGNKNFYKGTRASGIGRFTKHGSYIIDPARTRTFVVPVTGASASESLRPFVSSNVPEIKQLFQPYKGPTDPLLLLQRARNFVENGKTEKEFTHNYVERV